MPDPSRELAPLPGPGATPTDAAGLEAGDPEPVAARAVRTSLRSRCCRPPPCRSPLAGPYGRTVAAACRTDSPGGTASCTESPAAAAAADGASSLPARGSTTATTRGHDLTEARPRPTLSNAEPPGPWPRPLAASLLRNAYTALIPLAFASTSTKLPPTPRRPIGRRAS